jgi:hypothetical protein
MWYMVIVLCVALIRFSGQFLEINPDAKFLDGEQVEGIHLVTDFDLVRQLQVRLGQCANGPTNFFPAMWPVNLSTGNISSLESKPHVVTPKPYGTRYLLYVNPSGEMFLENLTQHIFRIDDDHAIQMISSDGQSITDVILDGVVTRVSEKHPDAGRLTFVIMDATLCRGVGLTHMGISQRIAFVKVNSIIMLITSQSSELKLVLNFY